MKKHKYRFLLPMSLLLLLLLALGAVRAAILAQNGVVDKIQLLPDGRSRQETISLWQNGDRPEYYFFLPSHAQPDALRLVCGGSIEIDGRMCRSGELLAELVPGTPHTIRFGSREGSLTLLQADPMPSMYIMTRTGDTNHIHRYRGEKESINLLYLDADGSPIYAQDSFRDQINLRGHSSAQYAKKPYTITLDAQADLLNCGEAVKWVLLANALDATNLRNKIVYDFARDLGMPYTPNCEFVNVYINGIYHGMYLLSEKTEIAPNRVELETERGYLVAANQPTKWDRKSNGFYTAYHAFEIAERKTVDPQIRDTIAARFTQIEEHLMNGNADALLPLIDLESWVQRYLVDEFFQNFDSEQASSYYYWQDISGDGPLYAGPVWDYDLTMSNNERYRNPNGLQIANADRFPWYSALMQLPAFRQQVEEVFASAFRPLVQTYLDSLIPELWNRFGNSIRINNMMWSEQCEMLAYDIDQEMQLLQGFLRERLAFLTDYLEHPEEYRFLSFHQDEYAFYGNFSYVVKRGSTPGGQLGDWVPDSDSYKWYYGDTNEPFDPQRPVSENQAVYSRRTSAFQLKVIVGIYAVPFLLCGLFGAAGLTLLAGYVRQIKQEGGRRKSWGK